MEVAIYTHLYASSFQHTEELIMSKRRSCSTIPHPVQNTRWIIEDDRYDNWSPNVLEFYYDGDTPTCYSTYMGITPLGKDWWGGLLGFCGNGFIQETVFKNLNIRTIYVFF